MGPAALRISPFPDRERFQRIGASTPAQPKYQALRRRAQEAMRLKRLASQTQVQHAELWAECVRLAAPSAAGSPKAKRARVDVVVGVEGEVEGQMEGETETETEMEMEMKMEIEREMEIEMDLEREACGDFHSRSELDGLSHDDCAQVGQAGEQPYGRVLGGVFVAANDDECIVDD